jgi:quinol monooxygenase YgiN
MDGLQCSPPHMVVAVEDVSNEMGVLMVIVQGTGQVDAARREQFLVQRAESMRVSRAEPGNLEYVIAADPIVADRVIISERWETQEDLAAHIKALTDRRRDAPPDDGSQVSVSFDIAVYEVAAVRPLG